MRNKQEIKISLNSVHGRKTPKYVNRVQKKMLHQFPCESPGRIKLKSNSQRIFLKYSNIKSSLFSFCDKVTAIKNMEERINTFLLAYNSLTRRTRKMVW